MRILILGVLLGGTLWLILRSIKSAGGDADPPGGADARLVRDPVCGTHIPMTSAVSLRHHGETQYFCSDRCAIAYQEMHP